MSRRFEELDFDPLHRAQLNCSGMHGPRCRRHRVTTPLTLGMGGPIRRPVDDAHHVVIDLGFDTLEQARRFRGFFDAKGLVVVNQLAGPRGLPGYEDPRGGGDQAEHLLLPFGQTAGNANTNSTSTDNTVTYTKP